MASVVLWVPVSAIVAALFLVPNGTEAAAPEQRRAGTLNVTPYTVYSPGHTTGGQLLNFSGDMGNGVQRIFLERRGNPNAKWVRVPDPRPGPNQGADLSLQTQADGTFDFDLPAPAMNNCFFRLVSSGSATDAHHFHSVFQDVEVTGPTTVTSGSPYQLGGDTALRPQDDRPIFPGRVAALQVRNGSDEWNTVATSTVGGNGMISFPAVTSSSPGTVVYRIRLADYQPGGDKIGWYPSLPYYVTVVQ